MPTAEMETPEEVTPDNPMPAEVNEGQKKADAKRQRIEASLKEIRLKHKLSWSTKRQALIRRVLRAFEYIKGNPYSVMNYGQQSMDAIATFVGSDKVGNEPEMYKSNDNVYQMLALSFIAALSPGVNRVRWMPGDPSEELDLAFAKKASTMMSYIERMNDIGSKQKLELLYLWCAGTYYSYVRNRVDSVRAGTTKSPIMEMQMQEVMPDRYLCKGCGTPTPAKQYNPFTTMQCRDCGTAVGQGDFYPSESANVPVSVGETEDPNSFTAINIFCLLNIDVDPSCEDLQDTPLLDLEGEISLAAIRASYPARYKEITAAQFGDGTINSVLERTAREAVASPTTQKSSLAMEDQRGTYSRCWIQPWAYSSLDDQERAKELAEEYPKGAKIVLYGQDIVLEVRAETLTEHWTECRTIKGLGMNPFGVGDIAISVQDRVDDTANNIHVYQDRMALPPVLYNAMLIDGNAMSKNRWGGGRAIPVYPSKKTPGMRFNMQDAMWQPTFHVDGQIYGYSQTLMTLMQLLTGVQPQIFGGGTTRGVDTATGQEQQLNTAMGRLMLYIDNIRAEHACRAKLAVKCMAADIHDEARIVIESQIEGQYENMYILQSEVQGEVHASPQSDQGFPASYGEMRDRLLQILGMVEKNPILQSMLSDPDMQKMLAVYLLPDGAKLPDDAMRTKIKMVLQKLSDGQSSVVQGIVLPSIMPDQDFDNMGMIVEIATKWAADNYELELTKPLGYANVRAYFKIASQMQQMSAAKTAAIQAQTGQAQAA